MLAASSSTSAWESSGRSAITILPSNSPKRPRTFESMCRATNSIEVWAWSNTHVPAGGSDTSWTSCVIGAWDTMSSFSGRAPHAAACFPFGRSNESPSPNYS